MLCGAKLRGRDAYCQKHGMLNGRCRLHGGLSPKGKDHWNFQHGHCTKEIRLKIRESKALLREMIDLGNAIGMFNNLPSFPRAK